MKRPLNSGLAIAILPASLALAGVLLPTAAAAQEVGVTAG
jgi:hypothetical protein